MQETFLKTADTAKLQEIRDYGWGIKSDPRKHRSGGGIAMLADTANLKSKSNDKLKKYKSFQVMELVLETEEALLRLVNVYRPPYTKKARYTESTFLEEFSSYLCDLAGKPGTPIICGDFNIHVERPEDFYPKKFLTLLDQFDLSQCVPASPTHDLGGTLDLIITTKDFKDNISNISIMTSGTTSDHFLVTAEVLVHPIRELGEETKHLSYRNFKSIVLEDFRSDLLESALCKWSSWCSKGLDESLKLYNDVLLELMDKHSPVINKKIKGKHRPWIDKELSNLRRKRRCAERAWRSGKGLRRKYVDLRTLFDKLEAQKRCKYNRDALMSSASDTKALHKKVNRLTSEETPSLPSFSDPEELAGNFRDFFAEKVNKIRANIEEENMAYHDAVLSEEKKDVFIGSKFGSFRPLTGDEITTYIRQLSNKFCCLDPIPTFLLKKCADELCPIILHIVNSSIIQAKFPADMKKAVVKPTLKKSNADTDCLKNYRPVSNLPVTSKLIERIVLDQLNDHLNLNDLHCPVQSGYRPNHSCETLLIRLTDDIFKEIHQDNIVVLVLLDLSAAFDTIDHSILLKKLEEDFGVTDKTLKWFSSYLIDRFFCVKVGSSLSDFLCLIFGVPQGSLLGPILFILYIKHLQKIAAKYGLDIQLYADDSQLYISFHPKRPTEIEGAVNRINECLAEIKKWMVTNFMKLNEDKTELLLIGKPLVLKKFDLEVKIQFGSTYITPTVCSGSNWKSLGVMLDGSLTLERQINNVKKNCSWTMTNLRTIRKYLDEKVKLMLVKQLIISKLDFCNSLYFNIPMKRLKKLKSILNGCVRFIYDINYKHDDLMPYYKKAHILPVEQRVFFKVCLLGFKVANGIAPVYLRELIEMSPSIGQTRSSSDPTLMKLPKMSRQKASNRRFSNYAPEAWNSLPEELRRIQNVDAFKGSLKNYLYDKL